MIAKNVFAVVVLISFPHLLATSASAHDTWLLPDRFETAPKSKVTLDLTSGMAFPALETGPKRARVQAAKCRLAGETFDITEVSTIFIFGVLLILLDRTGSPSGMFRTFAQPSSTARAACE